MFRLFFFNDTAPPEIYTLSLHDALPISQLPGVGLVSISGGQRPAVRVQADPMKLADRKSTRLNSSHTVISYAVFCLKKKTKARHRSKRHDPMIQVHHFPSMIATMSPPLT